MPKFSSNRFRLAKTDKPVYDSSILSTERRDFLNYAIDSKAYLEGYENFTKHVLYYVKKKEWMQKRVQYAQQLVDDAILDQTIELLSTNR